MSDVTCFWTEEIPLVRRSLRRFVFTSHGGECPGSKYGYHNSSQVLSTVVKPITGPGEYERSPGVELFEGSPHWPEKCECGYVFQQEDQWQVNDERYFAPARGPAQRPDPGAGEWVLRELPPGAMFDAWWYREGRGFPWQGADGIALVVVLPDNTQWCVDGPATNNQGPLPHWTRTGTIPIVTASPSIQSSGYHGWLRDGKLVTA